MTEIVDKKKILLFLGADIAAHLMMNQIVPMIIDEGFEPVLLFPEHKASSKPVEPSVKEFGFYERTLINDYVYPYLEKNSYHNPSYLTPNQLAEKYDLQLEHIKDVNDEDFVSRVAAMDNLAGALSIRCFQIFKPSIINVINELSCFFEDGRDILSNGGKGFFLNLHPGILPQYRGVLSTARAMAATAAGLNGKSFGCTLHSIDAGIDTGDILWKKTREFDLNKTVYATNIDVANLGAQAIQGIFNELAFGNTLDPTPQALISAPHHYYTYPTNTEIKQWENLGVRLHNPNEIKTLMIDFFSKPGTMHAEKFEQVIDLAIALAYQRGTISNTNTPSGRIPKPCSLRAYDMQAYTS